MKPRDKILRQVKKADALVREVAELLESHGGFSEAARAVEIRQQLYKLEFHVCRIDLEYWRRK